MNVMDGGLLVNPRYLSKFHGWYSHSVFTKKFLTCSTLIFFKTRKIMVQRMM
ncbi:hypothetical protein MOSE0_M09318 [Monosporozyma servazzii]